MKEHSALLPAEQRQAERQPPLPGRTGRLHLSVEGAPGSHGILALRDLSPFGVGVESSLLVEEGERIRLVYEEAGRSRAVAGTVVWRARGASAGRHQLGISLSPAAMAENIDFFRYMSGCR